MFLQEYEKLRVLGKGAFASVFKVRHAEFGYVRALKVSHEFIENKDDKAWQTFLNECKMLLQIGNGSHPNIVRIYQPRLLENKAVVEMDYIEGQSLCEYIAKQKFIPFDEFKRFAEQIVGALAYCHADIYRFMMDAETDNLVTDPNDGRKFLISTEKEKELINKYQVIHNDLHSNNIIRRDYDGQYILLDFGLSIQQEHCVKSSSRGDGAIEYTAPEKLDQNLISAQSDVYSLGILLYEMLTGRVPFPCDGSQSSQAKVYMAHLNATPPDILALRAQAFEETHPGEVYENDLPEGLVGIVMRCLSKNPLNRYENAKELLDDLNCILEFNSPKVSHLNGNPDSHNTKDIDNEERIPETKTKCSRTKRIILAAVAIVALLLILGATYFFYFAKDSKETDGTPVTASSPATLGAVDSISIRTVDSKSLADNKTGDSNSQVGDNTSKVGDNSSSSDATAHRSNSANSTPGTISQSTPKSKASNPEQSRSIATNGTLSLGYGSWIGGIKNGKPDGRGKIVFTSSHSVDRSTREMANPGDYFIANYDNGHLISGKLYDSAGNLLKTIIP